ncbi:MAG: carbohydrate ABC transporter substrate-binding protein [Oscillospiraceae bacterium]|nr:carbohydrate ABC transporter substrate-binding protein [Oscillospiraceae bacterium]
MNYFQKLTAVFCCVVLLTSAGCANDQIVTEQVQQTEISLSWWGNDVRNKYTIQAVETFEQLHPEIKVKCSYSEWSGYETRNRIQMISDTEADVMQINYGWLNQYSADGEGYYDIYTLDAMDISQFSEDVLRYGLKEGHLNAVPIAMNAQTVYINKTIYDNYGLDVPKTWNDLFHAAEVMKADNIYPLSAASKPMWLYLISYTEQTTKKKMIDSDTGNLNFNANDFKIMIEFYQRLVNEHVMPQVDFYERLELDNETYAGAVAWISDAVNYFGSAISSGREIVVADYTSIDGSGSGEGWYAKPATMYAVSKNTQYPKEAGILLNYLMNSSQMAELQGIEKGIPLSASAQETLKKDNLLTGIQYEASQKMEGCTLGELNPILETGSMIDDFFTVCNDVIYEKKDIETASSELYTQIKTYFK